MIVYYSVYILFIDVTINARDSFNPPPGSGKAGESCDHHVMYIEQCKLSAIVLTNFSPI